MIHQMRLSVVVVALGTFPIHATNPEHPFLVEVEMRPNLIVLSSIL